MQFYFSLRNSFGYISVLFILSIIFFSSINMAFADNYTKVDNIKYKHFQSILCLSIGFPYAASSDEFFKQYNNVLEGKAKSFDIFPNVGAGLKFQLFEKWRIGISGEYYLSKLDDGYTIEIETPYTSGTRIFDQNLTLNTYPVFIAMEYVPIESQFRTYTGMGIGAALSKIKWVESVGSTFPDDKRIGGNHFDNTIISPALRFYTGVELGFDKRWDSRFLGSFILEVKYTYIFRNVKIFKEISKQIPEHPKNWNQSFTILPGYISLNIGISVNFKLDERRKK